MFDRVSSRQRSVVATVCKTRIISGLGRPRCCRKRSVVRHGDAVRLLPSRQGVIARRRVVCNCVCVKVSKAASSSDACREQRTKKKNSKSKKARQERVQMRGDGCWLLALAFPFPLRARRRREGGVWSQGALLPVRHRDDRELGRLMNRVQGLLGVQVGRRREGRGLSGQP